MADVKISALPAATTPLAGTEVLPIVQSATTKQVSIANVTAGRAMAASSLTLTTPLAVTSGGTGIATAVQGALLSATGADTFSATRTPTLGLAGTAAGTLGLSGSTSGVVTLATAAAAGTWTFTLPTSGGTNGFILTTNGSGVSSWTNPTALGIDLDVGTTAITGGTTGRVLYNNAGVLGEYAVTGTGSVVLGTTPTFTTSALFPAGAVGAPGISVSGDTNTGIYFPAADTIGFVEGGVEAMRITSAGNVGIGTSSPASILQIGASNTTTQAQNIDMWGTLAGSNGDIGRLRFFNVNAFNTKQIAQISAARDGNNYGGALLFSTGTQADTTLTERLRIDSSGNLGLGVTPSAWSSSFRAIQFFGLGAIYGSSSALAFSNNTYNDGSNKYIGNGLASRYYQATGTHVWETAANNTSGAGAACTLSTAMTLDASGNLGIGTSSPSSTLQVDAATEWGVRLRAASNTTTYRATYLTQRSLGTLASPTAVTAGTIIGGMDAGGHTGSAYTTGFNGGAGIWMQAAATWAVGDTPTYMAFLTNPVGSAGYVERMRIDSNGNVIINTAAIATNATNGFLYVPTCAGTPTGTPTTYTGRAPIVVDTTNNKLYFYSSGVWRDAGP